MLIVYPRINVNIRKELKVTAKGIFYRGSSHGQVDKISGLNLKYKISFTVLMFLSCIQGLDSA